MDPSIAQALEQRLAQRAVKAASPAASAPAKPLFLQDLEERARERNVSVDQLLDQDRQVLNETSKGNHLHADEVAQGAQDEQGLSYRAFAHYQNCLFCKNLVAAARPDHAKHRRLLDEMAEAAATNRTARQPSALVHRTEAVFRSLDRGVTQLVKYGGPVTVCALLLFYFSPDWLRVKGPTWSWSDRQLQKQTVQALQEGNAKHAESLASELVKREPSNPGWYLLRSQALEASGQKELANADLATADRLLTTTGKESGTDRLLMLKGPAASPGSPP